MKEPAASRTVDVLFGLLAGMLGGFVSILLVPPANMAVSLVVDGALGAVFGLIMGPRIRTAGAGLSWGQVYGLLWWLFGSLTLLPLLSGESVRWTAAAAQETLPQLLVQVIGYGAVMGLSYYALCQARSRIAGRRRPTPDPPAGQPVRQEVVPRLARAIVVGALGGAVGSWLFSRGVESAEFFPLVAGLMGSDAMEVGRLLHYTIGITIGISFGVLYSRDARGVGSSLVWGLNYGLVWWIIGPMTLLPTLLGHGMRPDWSVSVAQENVPSLVAHMLYGAIVGLFYALANRIWRALFVDSDPVNRALESQGSLGLRNALMGLGSGIIGGLLFTLVMWGTGTLTEMADLVMARSLAAGLAVYLVISIAAGMSYGLLFGQEAAVYGTGLGWGAVYGLAWWLLGGVTLFPILLGLPVDWSLATVAGLYPLLVGHLLYGVALGLFFQFLARRFGGGRRGRLFDEQLRLDPARQRTGQAAPALWVVTLVLGVMLPLLLSMN